mmetsp:Transcript_5836/g.17609  ORF Transcript_5836/g.17609 Transcript_5836/m.17609 type:complete len:272 (-) Transcript_5836:450-1265(-)
MGVVFRPHGDPPQCCPHVVQLDVHPPQPPQELKHVVVLAQDLGRQNEAQRPRDFVPQAHVVPLITRRQVNLLCAVPLGFPPRRRGLAEAEGDVAQKRVCLAPSHLGRLVENGRHLRVCRGWVGRLLHQGPRFGEEHLVEVSPLHQKVVLERLQMLWELCMDHHELPHVRGDFLAKVVDHPVERRLGELALLAKGLQSAEHLKVVRVQVPLPLLRARPFCRGHPFKPPPVVAEVAQDALGLADEKDGLGRVSRYVHGQAPFVDLKTAVPLLR